MTIAAAGRTAPSADEARRWFDGVPAEAVEIAAGGLPVRVWRACDLGAFVDAAALLGRDDAPEPPYWMHAWPGAMALARIVAQAPDVRLGARVIELGCGLAIPSLVAARRGAAVLATDRVRAPLRFAVESARLNDAALAALQMDWAAPALRGAFDVCLGADVAYDLGGDAILVHGIARLVRPGGVVWLADSVNTARAGVVAGLRAAGFAVRVEERREEEDGRPVWVRLIEGRRP